MIIDRKYKVSAFGDYDDIKPTTENLMYFLEKFKTFKMVPSVFQEIKLDNRTQQPTPQQRIAIISADNSKQILIASNRLDFEVTVADNTKLNMNQLDEINERICNEYRLIFEKFGKKASRLALNTESLVVELEPSEIAEFMSKYSNPISIYNESPMDEWSTRLMVRKRGTLCAGEEIFNVITNLTKTQLHRNIDGEIEFGSGFSVNVDINTIAENANQRFSENDIAPFIKISTEWWGKILGEMG